MSDRVNWYHRQKVSESELDLAFDQLERADRALATDLNVFGIISGALPTEHAPIPDLSIDLTGPARAYDRLGQRIYFAVGQTVDLSVDSTGMPTEVIEPGKGRWLGVFLKFDRSLSDPRTDGNSQVVYFRRDESFQVVVKMEDEAPTNQADRVELEPDALLVCDVHLRHGQKQILAADLSLTRRQVFLYASADAVRVLTAHWQGVKPSADTVQSSLDGIDTLLSGHIAGSGSQHEGTHIRYTPHGFLASTALQSALDELIDSLTSSDATKPGASRIGADAVPGIPYSLMPGNLNVQVSFLLKWLNAHLSAATQAHAATAISAATHNYVTAQNVQAQLQEIVTALLSTADMPGASRIGNSFVGGIPRSIAEGTLRDQLAQLLAHLNGHITGQDHDSRYYPKTDSDARYYQSGKKVEDADTLDGFHALAFASSTHNHDDRYLRRIFQQAADMPGKSDKLVATLDSEPEVIFLRYAAIGSTGVVDPTWRVNGAEAANIQASVTRVDLEGGRIAYKLALHNLSDKRLMITVGAYVAKR